jgi:hypothetical protein
MKWLCKIIPHNWDWTSSTICRGHTKRHWICKRCGEKFDEYIWHDIL